MNNIEETRQPDDLQTTEQPKEPTTEEECEYESEFSYT